MNRRNSFTWPRVKMYDDDDTNGWPTQFSFPHPTVRVQGIDIDKGIAPLLRAIWRRGIRTVQSCQWQWGSADPNAPVWVLFASGADADRFFRRALRDLPEGAYPSTGGTKRSWRVWVRRLYRARRGADQMNIAVLIPQRDVPAVIRNLGHKGSPEVPAVSALPRPALGSRIVARARKGRRI